MRGIFDDEETKPKRKRRDTELTLGSGTLLAMFFGLVLLCGLCFGLGYTMGRFGSPPPSDSLSRPTPAAQTSLQANASLTKPSATPAGGAIPPVQAAGTALAIAASENTPATTTAQSTPAQETSAAVQPVAAKSPALAAQPSTSPAQPKVQPALASQPALPQHAQPAATPSVHPALPSTSSYMVQIAAVSSPQDAEVLMNALRQRGYAVTVRRNLTDNLIHVRVGPFATRAMANKWRLKLLNDGYNAVVQP